MVTYVAEHDVLKDDGVLLHKRLRMIGGKSELIQWDGGIHAQVVFSLQNRNFLGALKSLTSRESFFLNFK